MQIGQILNELRDVLEKKAFIPSPNSPQAQAAQGQPGAGSPPNAGSPPPSLGGAPSPASSLQPDPTQGGAPGPAASGADPSQGQPGQAPGIAGTDLQPSPQSPNLKNTPVTVSGGKASQSHLKTESLKVKHQFEHQKMLREERQKQEEEQQKKQQEQMVQQQQQQGMMGGGIYGGGPMDGSNPQQAGGMPAPTPAQPPQPGQM